MSSIPSSDVIKETFGPYVTGIMIEQLLMGGVAVQAFDYYRLFPTDTIFNRIIVVVLVVACVLQSVMNFVGFYVFSVRHYADYAVFDAGNWTTWFEFVVTAVLAATAQAFFVERVWSATKSTIVAAIGGLAIAASLAAGVASTVKYTQVKSLSAINEVITPMTIWLVSGAIINITIAGSLIFFLSRVRSQFEKTEAVLTRIVRLSFTTGAVTAAIAILNIALYLGVKDGAWHLIPQLSSGKIYAISVFVTLSSRKELREIMQASGNATLLPVTAKNLHTQSSKNFIAAIPPPPVSGIRVQTTHTYHHDNASDSDLKLPIQEMQVGRPVHVRSDSQSTLGLITSALDRVEGPLGKRPKKKNKDDEDDSDIELNSLPDHGYQNARSPKVIFTPELPADRPFAPHPSIDVSPPVDDDDDSDTYYNESQKNTYVVSTTIHRQ